MGSLHCIVLIVLTFAQSGELPLKDGPAEPGAWGFRPAEGEPVGLTPPGFVWRMQDGAASYEVEVEGPGGPIRYGGIALNAFCPDAPLPPGSYRWRYRYRDDEGNSSAWSRARPFTIAGGAVALPLPDRQTLLARIPAGHPRLFMRPGEIPALREIARGEGKAAFGKLVVRCEKLLADPPPAAEPPKYPEGTVHKSEAWREIWWGNRTYTIRVLESAATLAFTGLVGERPAYRDLAKRLLLDAARWDPRGATGYRYNDEAGMPFAYHFSRAYTLLHDLLSEEERALCRAVMTERGREMYRHLCPRHLWFPYSSHSNRAWHFLGEAGIAFHGDIPEAADWVWFAANVFRCVYPVWSDEDGGWHEGISYWASYIGRFTWWADVMKKAMDLDAYRKPYFHRVGYYPLYLMPPGKEGGGFGDLCGNQRSDRFVPLMAVFAAQARNPYWQWYVEAHGGAPEAEGYIGFLRGTLPGIDPLAPTGLPSSRCFRGTGQAVLNTNLLDASENVQVIFKSSPFGSQSHGYEAQNAFLLNVFGERILVRSGYRDIYGSAHHRDWMWHTRSVNAVTVNGQSQVKHSAAARGRITAFEAGERIDFVAGEAGEAYGGLLDAFARRILFIKPDLIVIFDSLEAPEPATFEWWLHGAHPFAVTGREEITVEGRTGAARIAFLHPGELDLSLTDRFDPPPRERVKLEQWHLAASRKWPMRRIDFVTVIRPYRKGSLPPEGVAFEDDGGRFILRGAVPGGTAQVTLGRDGAVSARVTGDRGKVVAVLDTVSKQ